MKRYRQLAALLLLTFISKLSPAQTGIYGTLIDNGGKPIANATAVLLKAKDSSVVKGTVSNGSGEFVFDNVRTDRYLVQWTITGFQQQVSPVFTFEKGSSKNLGVVQLAEKPAVLNAVTVQAKKPLFEQQIDRMVVNVAASITSSGSNVLEVLERSPGITVDRQNGAIAMNGKDGIVLMINGRLSRMPVSAVVQMLEGMDAANIEKIELISTPPAGFDAEGNAGFINLVLKKNTQDGTNGSYSVTAGYGRRPQAAASTNFNYRHGSLNLYGDFSYGRRDYIQENVFDRLVQNGPVLMQNYLETTRHPVISNYNGRLGFDYELTKKTIVGALVNAYYNRYDMDASSDTRVFNNGRLDSLIRGTTSELHTLSNYSVNVNLLHNFSANEKFSVNFDYMYYLDKDPVSYFNDYFSGNRFLYALQTRSNKTTPIDFTTFSGQYTKRLSKALDMEAGFKYSYSNFTNEVAVDIAEQNGWKRDPEFSSKYLLAEKIYAGYATVNWTMGQKTNSKLGLRYENTDSELITADGKKLVDRNYGNLFPSLFLAQKLTKQSSLNLAYSKRITRPTFNDLAPYVMFMDPNTFFTGNPALQPSFSDALKVDYLLNRNIISFNYTFEDGPITRHTPRVNAATNKQTIGADNQNWRKTLSLTVAVPLTITRWWTMQNSLVASAWNLNGYYMDDKLSVAQKNLRLNTAQNFVLPKAWSIELSGYFQTATLYSIYRINAMNTMHLGIQKKLPDNKSTFRFNISDIYGYPLLKPSINQPDKNLVLKASLMFNNTFYKLTYTRLFGNDKVKAKRVRTTGAEEEKQRVEASN